jgi:hypothetical protein
LLQVALIIAIGALISNLVCMTLWSQSAKKNLQANMIKTLDSFSTLLSLLTSTFLLEDESYQPSQEKISKAVADHQATFTRLKKSLAEAQSERLCGGPGTSSSRSGGDPYEDAVDSLTRLAQHLNGLRSGTSHQYELAKAHWDGKIAIRRSSMFANVLETELPKGKEAPSGGLGHGNTTETENVMLRAAAAVFGDFVGELDSPLRSLSVSRGMFHIPQHVGICAHSSSCSIFIGTTHLSSRRKTTSRHVRRQLDTFVAHFPIKGVRPRMPKPSWTSLWNSPTGSNERFSSSTALPITPCCVSTNEQTLVAPLLARPLLPPPPLLSTALTHSFLLVKASMCFWCTCTFQPRRLDWDFSLRTCSLYASFLFAMQEFARELISLTVAMSRIYAAERPEASRRWLSRISAVLSSVFCCCLRSRIKGSMSEPRSRQNDTSASSKSVRRGLHRRLCTISVPLPPHPT